MSIPSVKIKIKKKIKKKINVPHYMQPISTQDAYTPSPVRSTTNSNTHSNASSRTSLHEASKKLLTSSSKKSLPVPPLVLDQQQQHEPKPPYERIPSSPRFNPLQLKTHLQTYYEETKLQENAPTTRITQARDSNGTTSLTGYMQNHVSLCVTKKNAIFIFNVYF
jgi:hypothetical protein